MGFSSEIPEPSAKELVDEIILEPGYWFQICAPPSDDPFGLGRISTSEYGISDENVARLKKRRAEVIELIHQRLDKAQCFCIAHVNCSCNKIYQLLRFL